MSLHESASNRIHEILKEVWSREYSADDGLEEIEIQLMGYEFAPEKCDAPVGWISPEKYRAACESKMEFLKQLKEARQIITDLVEYAECNDPGNPHIGRAKGFLSGGEG